MKLKTVRVDREPTTPGEAARVIPYPAAPTRPLPGRMPRRLPPVVTFAPATAPRRRRSLWEVLARMPERWARWRNVAAVRAGHRAGRAEAVAELRAHITTEITRGTYDHRPSAEALRGLLAHLDAEHN